MTGCAYGYIRCPDCGLGVPTAKLEAGEHECEEQQFLQHQKVLLEKELETREEWVTKRTEFDRWLQGQ